MQEHRRGGVALRQTPPDERATAEAPAGQPAIPPALLTDVQARQLLNVGETTFLELIDEPWMPQPIQLGPRLRRWPRDELLQAVTTRAPRSGKSAEPAQLRRQRIERAKRDGCLA